MYANPFIYERQFDFSDCNIRYKGAGIVIPIFKSGCRNDVTNKKSITILDSIPKIFESINHDKLYYTPSNFFRVQVDLVYTDFSKAFGMVDHGILVAKLKALGTSGNVLSWLSTST